VCGRKLFPQGCVRAQELIEKPSIRCYSVVCLW
jgi:hypothetical protein